MLIISRTTDGQTVMTNGVSDTWAIR